ncbi:hypothetical protein [Oryzomicrobium sp.]|uniref:hypothetical protein n=1 Tax=Oryzomicrobium sp. TaxID=1911578 RepID=UPI0025E6F319|nr:hypothetical protein [Oryzomicrobium sp.]MCE1241837.1 hypothetical protein [Oryzomicrobium sp.]
MSVEVFVLNFLYSLLATLIGGGILALLLFWLKENVFPLPNIAGRWYFQVRTVNTTYNPYKGMVLGYVAILLRVGNRIEGTVEKVYENSSTGERYYEEKNRTRAVIKGFVEKRYFSKDFVSLHVVENGFGRESTHFYELVARSDEEMAGSFTSMVANQDGEVKWQREKPWAKCDMS